MRFLTILLMVGLAVLICCLMPINSNSVAARKITSDIMPTTPAEEEAAKLLLQSTQQLRGNKLQTAITMLERAVVLWPKSALIHHNLGYARAQAGDYTKAKSEFEYALRLDPSMTDCMVNIASCYESMGQIGEAIKWFDMYLQQNPKADDAQQVRGIVNALKQHQNRNVKIDPNASDYFAEILTKGKMQLWPKESLPLRVFIDTGHGIISYRESFRKDLTAALDAWVLSSEGRLGYSLVSDRTKANLICSWTSNLADVKHGVASGEQGKARVSTREKPTGPLWIIKADIILLTRSIDEDAPISDKEMLKACLHEIGHALGLAGHSSNNRDVMFFAQAPSVSSSPTVRDKATLLRLYGAYPKLD